MANYHAPYHPLTDRQQTAWVTVYERVLSEAPEELRSAFEQFEQIITAVIVENTRVPRLRDTHIETAKKYSKAWLATLLEQGYLNKLAAPTANEGDSLAEVTTAP